MKSNKSFQVKGQGSDRDDVVKKAVKLSPIKKSGKEKHFIYSDLDEQDEEELMFGDYKKRESVLDYFDDEESTSDI